MKKQDFIVLGAVLIIAAVIFGALQLGGHGGSRVVIEEDGRTVAALPLQRDATYRAECAGGYNTIVIKDGTVCVSEADCPDKICVHHRKISREGESIICLPHRLVVSIE